MKGNVDHFKRARLMFAAIGAILANPNLGMASRDAELAKIGPYRSRGKGRGSVERNYFRPYCNNGGRNIPHQGEREIARRCRQIASGQLTASNGLVAA